MQTEEGRKDGWEGGGEVEAEEKSADQDPGVPRIQGGPAAHASFKSHNHQVDGSPDTNNLGLGTN